MNWDALVIGAGPAGSVTARELARRGCRVLLVDKATFPRAKVCGCCLNGTAIDALERLDLAHVLAGGMPLEGVRIAAGARTADVRLPRGIALSRDVFDARLVEEAVAAGVEFRPGIVVSRESEFLTWARVVIIASGLTGGDTIPTPGSRIGAGVVLPSETAPRFYGSHTIHMATGRGGYVGLVRVEDNRLDVAAAFDAAFVKSAGGPGAAAKAARAWDERLAREWETTHERIVGRRQRVCRVVSRVLRSPALTGIAIGALRWFPALSRPVVAALNRPASHGLPV